MMRQSWRPAFRRQRDEAEREAADELRRWAEEEACCSLESQLLFTGDPDGAIHRIMAETKDGAP